MSTPAQRLKDAMARKGLTIPALAAKSGMSQSYVEKIRNAAMLPSREAAIKIAGVLEVSIEYLLCIDDVRFLRFASDAEGTGVYEVKHCKCVEGDCIGFLRAAMAYELSRHGNAMGDIAIMSCRAMHDQLINTNNKE